MHSLTKTMAAHNYKEETQVDVKGVKKVRSEIKLCSYYFSHYVSYDTNVTGILLSQLT